MACNEQRAAQRCHDHFYPTGEEGHLTPAGFVRRRHDRAIVRVLVGRDAEPLGDALDIRSLVGEMLKGEAFVAGGEGEPLEVIGKACFGCIGAWSRVSFWTVQRRQKGHPMCNTYHELAHWTGHVRRLDREFGARFGDAEYAMEELVAELASAMIGADLGLPVDHLDDHASYIATWLKVLKADPRAILTAAAKAETATALLLSYRSGEANEGLRAAA